VVGELCKRPLTNFNVDYCLLFYLMMIIVIDVNFRKKEIFLFLSSFFLNPFPASQPASLLSFGGEVKRNFPICSVLLLFTLSHNESLVCVFSVLKTLHRLSQLT